MSNRARRLWLLGGLLFVVGLPLLGRWARNSSAPTCALDGVPIDPLYQVTIVDAQGQPHVFCCLRCAGLWSKRAAEPPRAVTVTDEASGQEVPAENACYVRSSVVTTPVTGNRIHTFRRQADAQEHAQAFAGVVLPEDEKPFQ